MKIKELASELNLTGTEVLEKAKTMGIEVSKVGDELSDMDATAVRNTIMKSGTHTETKVVKVRAKKSENDKKEDEPKVTVKAANIKLPEVKKSAKPAAKTAAKPAAKPPVGKPVLSKEIEGRKKPLEGKPVISKTMLEERIAKDAEQNENAVKAEATEVKREVKEEAKPEQPAKPEAPRRQSRLKVIKRAEDVRREEAEAAEKRAAERKAAAEKKSAEKKEEKAREIRTESHLTGERIVSPQTESLWTERTVETTEMIEVTEMTDLTERMTKMTEVQDLRQDVMKR